MEIVIPFSVQIYTDQHGKNPFQDWFLNLKDEKTQAIIINRINRLSLGNFGDCKKIGRISEIRINHGPGYRIYFAMKKQRTVILLLGGSKKTQNKDILKANILWKEYGE